MTDSMKVAVMFGICIFEGILDSIFGRFSPKSRLCEIIIDVIRISIFLVLVIAIIVIAITMTPPI